MLAVPLHGDDVAPRFCSAEQFAIAEVDGGRVHRICQLTIRDEAWSRRLERLSIAGVKVLLCGGFNRSFLPHAQALGIRVISGLAGEAERLIDAFARDEIEQYRFLPGRGRRRGRHGAGGHLGAERELRGNKQNHAEIRQNRSGWCPAPMTTRVAVMDTASREKEIAMDRIAISIVRNEKGLNDPMDDRFGRAEAFLVVDGVTGEAVETIDNASVDASHGAGTGAANMLKSAGVGAVISGRFGPKASDALQALGIEAWVAPPGITAGEAVRLLQDGDLSQM